MSKFDHNSLRDIWSYSISEQVINSQIPKSDIFANWREIIVTSLGTHMTQC